MKKLFVLFIVFILCFTSACNKTAEAPDTTVETPTETVKTEGTPLLFKVADKDGSEIYLFGSVHIGREDFYPLNDYIMDAVKSCDGMAFEFDIISYETDISAQIASLTPLIYVDGTTIKDNISPELYSRASDIMAKENMPAATLDFYTPAVWSSFIDDAIYAKLNLDYDLGIDRYLTSYAKENNMPIYEIESGVAQSEILASFSPELQEFLLQSSVESYENLEESKVEITTLLDAWYTGDSTTIIESSFPADLTEEEKILIDEYNYKMLTLRNQNMADFAIDALENNEKIFICVGAAHIVGENSISDILAQAGYNIEIIK